MIIHLYPILYPFGPADPAPGFPWFPCHPFGFGDLQVQLRLAHHCGVGHQPMECSGGEHGGSQHGQGKCCCITMKHTMMMVNYG